MTATPATFYDLEAVTNRGQPFKFSDLKGKVVLVVNVASKCGFTGQYEGLEELYKSYEDKGFEILGFPCNQFKQQEPGSDEEIASFCSVKYGTTFQLMKKIDVNGDDTHPVYRYLKEQKKQLLMSQIKWNFEKFLIDRKGNVVDRFASTTTPQKLKTEIEKLLEQSA